MTATRRLPAGSRCGIHGLSTESGRCEACDVELLTASGFTSAQLDLGNDESDDANPNAMIRWVAARLHRVCTYRAVNGWSGFVESASGGTTYITEFPTRRAAHLAALAALVAEYHPLPYADDETVSDPQPERDST